MPLGRQVFTIAALTLALTAPSAHGQVEEGVTVDPSSPVGKEYALPIQQARRDTADGGNGGRGSKGSQPTPALGEGVRPDRRFGRGDRRGDPAARTRRGGVAGTSLSDFVPPAADSASFNSERARERDAIDRAVISAGVGDGGASEGSLALLGGGVAVIVLGVAAGLALRRRAT